MSEKIRIGVVGAGLIGQVEHLPNLKRLSQDFELVCVADASAAMRGELERRGLRAVASYEEVLSAGIDAVLIAAPDQYHAEITLAALAHGKHVFCEKPLCFSVGEAEEIAAARDAAGRVVQVGYMKRFDPSYEMLLSLLPPDAAKLRMISVEVQDPDSWPFNQHQGDFVKTGDVSPALIADGNARRERQVRRATGQTLAGSDMWGFTNSYCSSLIHDINAVHGMLDVMGIETGAVVGAAFFAGGDGGHGSVRLRGTQALWQMTHLFVPGIADYVERITLYFDDASYELTFPSPYLNHFPTRLSVARSEGIVWQKTEYRASYEEAFVRELVGFRDSVRDGCPVRNTVEAARRDLQLVADLAAVALRST
ncbi:Gfo/Idh/MocA family protein [Labrys wisconsinensis]|uniref:Dehydrogenase n=1 Tax=Labrys wisconsinensis TaxID=425677 RepID=A0ABU0JKK2_9HYPH|nr:Gfo/Idh/MocA family oxidoreductase [Labrys wisconsinensis]MDQ0474816.1 putative dehydrogenase [Labrys wisconsinensis]